MKPFVKKTLLVTIGVLLLAVGGFVCLAVWWIGHAEIDQSNGLTSRDAALSHCAIPLPASAHNVQYASYAAGMQEGHLYVRFEAPVADCYKTAKTIFAEHAKQNPSHYVIPKFQPTNLLDRERSSDLRIDWFDNDKISTGVVAGTGWSWEPKIWIDEERGVLYYEVND